MNVLIDFSQIPKNKVGVGVYAQNLIRHLSMIDRNNKYVLIVQDDDDCLDDLISRNISLIRLNHRIFRRFVFRMVMEQVLIPIIIKLKRIDVVHSLHYSFPFLSFKAHVVVTIHDMTFFLYPNYHLRAKQIYFRFFIKRLVKRADAIIAVSKSTKRDFLRLMKASPEKVAVIPLGRPSEAERCAIGRSDSSSVISKLGVNLPYILYVGTLEPRKNIQRLINVFKRLTEHWPQGHLVIAGAKGWSYAPIFDAVKQHQLQSRVFFLGFISDFEKYCLMAKSDVFVYPSLYEGFGLPVLEAMSMGTATITSNRSSMPEVAGQAAVLIDPEDEFQLHNGLTALLSDRKFREDIGRRGQRRSAQFRWRQTAQLTLDLYKSVNGKKP